MVDARDDRAKRNIATALCNQLITTACGIVTLRVLLASFGSEAYGICASITQFLSYIMLLESGIGGVARAKLYAPLARRDMCEVGAVYNAIRRFFYYVAAAFVVYSVLLGLTYHDLAGVMLYSRPYIFALVLTIGLSTLAKYMGGLANLTLIVADQRQYVNNCIMIAAAIVNAAAVVLLTQLKTQLLWVKLGSSLIFAVRPLLYRLYVKKHYPLPKAGKTSAVLDQKWTGIGQHIAYFLHMNTDIVLLTLFADVKLVAVYAVYNMVIGSIRAITESFSSGMEAKFGELIAKGRLDRLRRAFWRYQTLIISVSVVLFSCTGALIVPFVRLYTKGITDADYIQPVFALVLLMAEAVNCMMLPCSGLPAAANRFRQTRWGAYGEAAINIILSCALIHWSPLIGVALGTLTATVFRSVYYMAYYGRHILHIPLSKLLVRFAAAAALLGALAAAGCRLLQGIAIDNYFQWVLWGLATLSAVGAPTAFYCWKRLREAKYETNPDRK